MKLFVESVLPVDATTAWELFESAEFQKRLEAQARLRTTVLSTTQEGGVEVRSLRYESFDELPGVAAKVLGTSRLSYDQTNRFDAATGKLEWVVKIPVIGDRVSASGRTVITNVAGGSKRVVDGDVTVRIPLVGGQVEGMIVKQFEASMGRAVDIVRDLIKERGLA